MEILNEIIKNLSYIGSVLSLIFLFQISNMAFGLGNSLCKEKSKFDSAKFLCWIRHTVISLFGIAVFTSAVSLIPFVLSYTGVTIPEAYGDIITVMMIILTAIKSMLTEASKAYENYNKLIDKQVNT